ncbi:sulfite exporter TauE/SafE family protein [Alteromonas sp. LMIT006]|uniref:sulfite exporter TauE/SafE family protein n=1 Tax=Alteromonadaceae TaxID=72275 RepID=UPI0020CA33E5|nr:sulfite exporter TauE/SafE family protein [Alteromonas sp. LMIT006]UTP73438.1 sulfite exporter TauE/SafE family protein [Alteromonas sp. LMIT006]
MLEWLLPAEFALTNAIILILSAGFTSFVSASMGIGGGLLLLIIMANIMPLAALIPVHGLVQLGSNVNRMVMTRQHIQMSIVGYFAIGAVIAALVASFVIVQLPLSLIELAIGIFVLAMVWGIKPQKRDLPKPLRILAGSVTTFLSMFIGATGPLVAAIIHSQRADKHQIVATFSTCMSLQHGLKMLVFGVVGFAFLPWLPLVIAMIVSGAIGTWIGLKLLNRFSANTFEWAFKGIMTVLALRTLYSGAQGLL